MDDEGVAIEDIPREMLYEQTIYGLQDGMVGKTCRLVHLQSARGQSLNGKTCILRGYDRDAGDARFHCYIPDLDESIKIKLGNLRPVEDENPVIEHFMENTLPSTDPELLENLQVALEHHSEITESGRPDMYYRLGLYRRLVEKIKSSSSELPDSDYCFPCGAGNEKLSGNFAVCMTKSKPPCWGNGYMDVRRVNIGLKGDNVTECSVCQEVLLSDGSDGDQDLVTLPCMHVFHEQCIVDWLESDTGRRNWNCPTCRAVVPNDMSTYRVQYKRQVQRRVDEYPVSGFCTKCQIMIMENNRNQVLPF